MKRKKDSISREVSAPINHPFPQLLVRSALGRESSLARAARTGAPDRDDDAKMAVRERGERGTGQEDETKIERRWPGCDREASMGYEGLGERGSRMREEECRGAECESESENELSGARRSRRTGSSPCLRRELQ